MELFLFPIRLPATLILTSFQRNWKCIRGSLLFQSLEKLIFLIYRQSCGCVDCVNFSSAYYDHLGNFYEKDINRQKMLMERNENLSMSAKTDELTKLFNRRGFMEYGQRLIEMSTMSDKTLELQI